ncbi:MAG: HAMP domain-containing histidine kinase [Bacteroidaceae bacterium]|nr:HAMP domain-containing histidine kinase [Bacteroidaceae bacterium]
MFERIRNIKIILIVMAIIIAIASLLISNYLTHDLQVEEKNRMEVWAEAMRSLNSADENTDLNLVLKVINGNNTIPVIVLDRYGNVQTHRNLGITFKENEDSVSILKEKASKMQDEDNSIRIFIAQPSDEISFDETDEISSQYIDSAQKNSDSFTVIKPQAEQEDTDYIEICYGESLMLKRLAVYPYIQLSVVVIFVLIAIFALFSSMKAEQNKVWVGLSKETAHQLGTPISSLMAWSEVLKETYPDDELLPEMEKDVKRLERIAERFSKIGSIPEPKPEDLCSVINRVVEYMDKRTSNKVKITSHLPSEPVIVNLVASLFEWVAENLCKNAVDAMSGHGSIDIYFEETDNHIALEFKDTGKGIAKSNFGSVFKPGFTTKKRGWGLGLSLAKRIVEEYHKGRIFVKSSEIGKGTTFRVELPK